MDGNMRMRAPTGNNPILDKDGQNGVPFYGNLYQGRVNTQDYLPPTGGQKQNSEAMNILRGAPTYRDDDPIIRKQLDACPYFSLCDMCVWGGMGPEFLDPGVVTEEEHQLLLLHSRAYYDKWKKIHSAPNMYAPRMRIRYGKADKCRQLLNELGVTKDQQTALFASPLMFDDCALVAVHPQAWQTCNMEPKLRDQLTGRVFEMAGIGEYQRLRLFESIAKMRTIKIVRRDRTDDGTEEPPVVLPFRYARTLHDLYTKLGLKSYSGQIKCMNFLDPVSGAMSTVTMNDEDTYFDFLVASFENANLGYINEASMSPYILHVERATRAEKSIGKWF